MASGKEVPGRGNSKCRIPELSAGKQKKGSAVRGNVGSDWPCWTSVTPRAVGAVGQLLGAATGVALTSCEKRLEQGKEEAGTARRPVERRWWLGPGWRHG